MRHDRSTIPFSMVLSFRRAQIELAAMAARSARAFRCQPSGTTYPTQGTKDKVMEAMKEKFDWSPGTKCLRPRAHLYVSTG